MDPPRIPEEWLRHVWQHQLFDTSALRTRDGRSVTIISPGIPNSDGGPDFAQARLRIGHTTFHGDVEVHVDASEWQAHRHHRDPHYNAVILHVVFTAADTVPPAVTSTQRVLPLLVLHPFVGDPLSPSSHTIRKTFRDRNVTPACPAIRESIPVEIVTHLLERTASERFGAKVQMLEERLKQLIDEQRLSLREPYFPYHGNPDDIPAPQPSYTRENFAITSAWEQLVYEGILEGMGYAKNRVPFRALARNLRLEVLRRFDITDRQTVMALLFGAAGLLPSTRTIGERDSRSYLRPLRRRWRELRPLLKIPLLHEADWLFFRLRPGNFPTARLASLCFLLPSLFRNGGLRRLFGIVSAVGLTTDDRINALLRSFHCVTDDFWRNHVTFGETTGGRGATLGRDRILDILMNTVVPAAFLCGRLLHNTNLQATAHDVYYALPASQENTITRAVRRQIPTCAQLPSLAWIQQGMIQLFRSFCMQDRCRWCDIGPSGSARLREKTAGKPESPSEAEPAGR